MARAAHWLKSVWRAFFPPRANTTAASATLLLACFVGVCAALLALAVKWLIAKFNTDMFLRIGHPTGRPAHPLHYVLIVIPPVAFLVSAFVIQRWAPETGGSGMDRVMSAVGHRAGYIRKRVILLKSALSVLCIGAGAPLGMEGPVVHSGAAIGSLLGRRTRLGVSNIRILVAAGAAAALAAKYGTPVGGAIFSAELILGSTSAEALLPILVASFLAVATRHVVRGQVAEYVVHFSYSFRFVDYLLLVPLGALCGIAAAWFIKTVFAVGDVMDTLFTRWWPKALFGGLVVGLIGFLEPDLLGMGNPVVQHLLDGGAMTDRTLLILAAGKALLCSVAMGSGTSGGIFAPALFAGAALGALFSHALAPLSLTSAPSGVFVIIGMAALMGAVMRAPLQAILIAFELTQSYYMVPALMLACVISVKVSEAHRAGVRLHPPAGARGRAAQPRHGLRPAGGHARQRRHEGALRAAAGRRRHRQHQRPTAGVGEHGLPRLGRGGAPGRHRHTLRPGRRRPHRPQVPGPHPGARPAGAAQPSACAPDQPLVAAWQTMGHYDYDCLPVCNPEDGSIIGICEKEAIVELHDRQSFVAMMQGR